MSIGICVEVLHEAVGHIVTCETVYRGKLIETEDDMNCQVNFSIREKRPSYKNI